MNKRIFNKVSSRLFIIFGVIVLFISAVGCKQEGCTDKNALNYNSVADKDDGSCVYCQTNSSISGTRIIQLTDFNSLSNYYMQIVSVCSFTETSLSYNSSQCGIGSCDLNLQIQNMTSQTIVFTPEVEFQSNNGFTDSAFNVSIPPNQVVNIGLLSSIPNSNGAGNCGTPNVDIQNNPNFTYH
jgi:hypothetical protein